MHVVLLSDTHSQLAKIKVPDGDMLIHSGDLTYVGSVAEISKELEVLKKLPHKRKLLICGNHDWLGERNPTLMRQMCVDAGIIYLDHEAITLDGFKIFGSAYSPEFCNWAFNVDRSLLKPYWDAIPEHTQILVTHGPPYQILDKCPDGRLVGCVDLRAKVQELKDLKLHSFGHIHHSYGHMKVGPTTFVNASNCNEAYKPINPPIIMEI